MKKALILLLFFLFSMSTFSIQLCFDDLTTAKAKAKAACDAVCKESCECEAMKYCVSLQKGSCDSLCTPNSNCIVCHRPTYCKCGSDILNASPFIFSVCKQESKCYNRVVCLQSQCMEESDLWLYDSCNGWLYEIEDCDTMNKQPDCGEWKCTMQGKTKTSKVRHGTKLEGYCENASCKPKTVNVKCEEFECPYGCVELQGVGNCYPKAIIKSLPAAVGKNIEISVGQSVVFDCSESRDPEGSDITCKWDFGGIAIATGTVVTRTFQKEGSYRIGLTVSDAQGLSDYTEVMLNVVSKNWPPNACFEVTPKDGVIGITEFTFDASCSSDPDIALGDYIAKYEWDFGDGTMAEGKKVKHIYTKKPIYGEASFSVKLKVSDWGNKYGSMSSMEIKEVIVKNNPPSTKFIAEPNEGKAPLSVSFSVLETEKDGHSVTYEWDFGDGSKASGTKATHTYDEIGTYVVTLWAIDEYGASSKSEETINVYSSRKLTSVSAENTVKGGYTAIFADCVGASRFDVIVKKGQYSAAISNVQCGTHVNLGPLTEEGEYDVIATLENCFEPECSKSTTFMVSEKEVQVRTSASDLTHVLVVFICFVVLAFTRADALKNKKI
ncbi:MAG: PKD domain-containing protein [Candidatus Diapherotrites archaeon]